MLVMTRLIVARDIMVSVSKDMNPQVFPFGTLIRIEVVTSFYASSLPIGQGADASDY